MIGQPATEDGPVRRGEHGQRDRRIADRAERQAELIHSAGPGPGEGVHDGEHEGRRYGGEVYKPEAARASTHEVPVL